MKRKIALKRLSSSDLTIFEHHFRRTAGTKQKAINLDIAVFIRAFFPGLREREHERFPVALAIFGPGDAPPHFIDKTILKQDKNWRLNGALICDAGAATGRYDVVENGDFSLFEFVGDEEPHAVRMRLLGGKARRDSALHGALESWYGGRFAKSKRLIDIDLINLTVALSDNRTPVGHPVHDFVDFDDIADVALGADAGAVGLRARRRGRAVSREELERARRAAGGNRAAQGGDPRCLVRLQGAPIHLGLKCRCRRTL